MTLTASDGLTGEGEASPLPGYSPETLDELRLELLRGAPRSGLARFAIESAMVDLAGKRRHASAATILGGALGQARVATSAVIVADDPLPDARQAIAAGMRALKIKIGRDARADAAMLVALREAIGPDVELRADANGGYSLDEARVFLGAVAAARLSFVEEPTSGEGLLALRDSPVPLAIDESLCVDGMEAWALAAPNIAVLVLKPARLGLFHARALALAAHRAKKQVVISHMFDGPWALAAASALALSLPFPPLACGLAPHDGLRAFPGRNIASLATAGTLVATDAPGLGLGVP